MAPASRERGTTAWRTGSGQYRIDPAAAIIGLVQRITGRAATANSFQHFRRTEIMPSGELTRSKSDRMIAGVCGGLARWLTGIRPRGGYFTHLFRSSPSHFPELLCT